MVPQNILQVVVTIAEHHSNIVPWQIVAQKTGAILKFVSLNGHEVLDIAKLREMLSRKTKIVVIHHVSNVLGRCSSWRFLPIGFHFISYSIEELKALK